MTRAVGLRWLLLLICVLPGFVLYSQEDGKTITGTVLDADGLSVIGASVLVEGTTSGTTTDFDGNFTLTVPEGSVLEVSYLGYTTQNIVVDSRMHYDITLLEDQQQLDEVVVIGYGTMKKKRLDGFHLVRVVKGLDEAAFVQPRCGLAGTCHGLAGGVQRCAGRQCVDESTWCGLYCGQRSLAGY